jgi:hypothetical protein
MAVTFPSPSESVKDATPESMTIDPFVFFGAWWTCRPTMVTEPGKS